MMLTIGRLAQRVGVSTDCVRFYERVGLLAADSKTTAGYRLYGDESVTRLCFIKHAQRCGFSLPQVRELLDAESACDTQAGCRMATEKKQEIEETIGALQAMKHALSSYIESCERYARSPDVSALRTESLISKFADHMEEVKADQKRAADPHRRAA